VATSAVRAQEDGEVGGASGAPTAAVGGQLSARQCPDGGFEVVACLPFAGQRPEK